MIEWIPDSWKNKKPSVVEIIGLIIVGGIIIFTLIDLKIINHRIDDIEEDSSEHVEDFRDLRRRYNEDH